MYSKYFRQAKSRDARSVSVDFSISGINAELVIFSQRNFRPKYRNCFRS